MDIKNKEKSDTHNSLSLNISEMENKTLFQLYDFKEFDIDSI